MNADVSELVALESDLLRSVGSKAQAVVKRGAMNVKKGAAEHLLKQTRPARTKHFRYAITFDLAPNGLSAEIGPDKNRTQGPLGNILEYGTATSAPKPHLNPALTDEIPRFEKALLDAAEQGILGG